MNTEAIYEEYALPVYRYLYSLCRNAPLAEEMCAETFYRAIRDINRYNGSCKLLTWLCSIAKHVWYAEQAKQGRHTTLDEGLPLADGSGQSPEVLAERAEDRLLLYQKLQALPPETREVVYLRLTGELSYADIGALLGKTENWARVTFYRAKQKLKKEMNPDEG